MRFKSFVVASLSLLIFSGRVGASPSPFIKRALITNAASINNGQYDFVIVGGGTSGLAAAYELSKDTSKKVLVIEAGGDPRQDPRVTSYQRYGSAFDDPNLDWPTSTSPQQSMGGRALPLHAGKGLGGSTNINGGVFSAPPSSQIDALGQLSNQNGLWNNLQPYLKKFQNYPAPSSSQIALGIAYDQTSHATGGQVDLGYPLQMRKDAQDDAFISSVKSQLQMSPSGDLGNGGKLNGAGFLAKYCKAEIGDIRVSSATAFFSPIESSRRNLAVLINTRVTKIIWKQSVKPATAQGVEFQSTANGPTYKVFASKVILAAGTLRSPKILEISGVGDKKVLNKIGVQQVINLPGVGTNLIDHVKAGIIAGGPRDSSVQPDTVNAAVAFPTMNQLISNATDMKAYMEKNIDAWAQQIVDKGASASKAGLLTQYRAMINGVFNNNWPVAELFWIPSSGNNILEAWNLMTFSRGTTHTTSASAWTRSDIDLNIMGVSIDVDLQIAAMRGIRKTLQGQALVNVMSGPENTPGFDANKGGIPQTNGGAYGRYDRWQKYLAEKGGAVWHLIGSCAMIPEALGGVVDSNFKVYQTSNVYIIDASTITIPLAGHITSMVYAMALKAASIISSEV